MAGPPLRFDQNLAPALARRNCATPDVEAPPPAWHADVVAFAADPGAALLAIARGG